jgi:hypothetical protein
MLEEAAVHQHQVVARSAAVGGSFHSRAGRVEQVEGVQGHPPAAAATVGQYPSEVVGEGSGGGIVETVDRDMDPGGPLEGGDGISERVHILGTASHLLCLDRGLHPNRLFGAGHGRWIVTGGTQGVGSITLEAQLRLENRV